MIPNNVDGGVPENPDAFGRVEGNPAEPGIRIKDLTFSYGRTVLFDNLNLKMEKGNIYGLLGLNGAGKTTLMKLLTGLLFPGSGELSVFGEEPGRRHPDFLSRICVSCKKK